MPFIDSFDPTTLKSILRVSNYWAKANRNQYPLAFSKALTDLYDWVPCPCNDQCLCRRQFNCTHHYIRKSNISFGIAESHFLSCYVDEKMREPVSSGTKEGRGKNAYEAISLFKAMWGKLPPLSTNLLCTEWCNKELHALTKSFKADIGTIYKAKWLSLLHLDTFVAYDTSSVRLLVREYRGPTYFDLISAIRTDLIAHLNSNSTSISSFRKYDNPHEFYPAIPINQLRPIGNIIDKLFLTL
ncbi:MAG: hypothetical protein KKH02_09695 [Proteobacteria bacterium]|nr:hypothetical protein [Pseudomonadota bacterium]MBU4582664.1 hypothetical protein [Pseudomonadota bacterium]MCG2740117.1 hypothetical protein [Syntrophaceae bacterium]